MLCGVIGAACILTSAMRCNWCYVDLLLLVQFACSWFSWLHLCHVIVQSIYRDFNEVQRTSACSDRTTRVHSAGSASSRHGDNQSHSISISYLCERERVREGGRVREGERERERKRERERERERVREGESKGG